MNSEERQAWLDSLKADDEIAYLKPMFKGNELIHVWAILLVKKRNKSGSIITPVYTFNKKGICYPNCECMPVTDEIRDSINRMRLTDILNLCCWEKVPVKVLQDIVSQLSPNSYEYVPKMDWDFGDTMRSARHDS